MSTTYIDEYLVKLGAAVDASGMQRFHQALREAALVADASAMSIAGAFFKAQVEIVSGFVAIGTAALGLVDKVAMADQQYRLFALHMYMSKENARSLKVAMDALGEPLENLTWDKELRERTHQLILDQQAMAPRGDFDAQMRKIRDIRFEFTRMEVEGEYLAMNVVQGFLAGLGAGPDELLKRLRQFNDWVIHDMPQLTSRIVTMFLPIWVDVKDVVTVTGEALVETALAFTNLIGAITGDRTIEGQTFDLEKFAAALAHVVHWFAEFAKAVDWGVEAVARLTAGIGELLSKIPSPVLALLVGTSPLGQFMLPSFGPARSDYNPSGGSPGSGPGASKSSVSGQQAATLAQQVSRITGIAPDILWSQWAHETGNFSHLGGLNNLAGIRLPGSTQYQNFGSLEEFGKRYAEVLGERRYSGITGAQNTDQFASILKAGRYYEGEEKDYAHEMRMFDNVYRRQYAGSAPSGSSTSSTTTIGSINVHVDKPNATNSDVAHTVRRTLEDAQNKRTQRTLAELNDLSWGN